MFGRNKKTKWQKFSAKCEEMTSVLELAVVMITLGTTLWSAFQDKDKDVNVKVNVK